MEAERKKWDGEEREKQKIHTSVHSRPETGDRRMGATRGKEIYFPRSVTLKGSATV